MTAHLLHETSMKCPESNALISAIRDTETVAPDLAAHIDTCLHCQGELDHLTAGPTLRALRGKLDEQAAAAAPNQPGGGQAETDPHQEPHTKAEGVFAGRKLGDYLLLRLLGSGGMGQVYEAEDEVLKRRVALKLIKPKANVSKLYRERFMREARAIARVSHDHISPIYQAGEAEGLLFIAMPLLKGETLEQRLTRGAIGLDESLQVLQQTAAGLAATHAASLIHRDIKPSNIWLEERPEGEIRVRLLDFGLARDENDEQPMTKFGTILGTPEYMAPEQARGQVVDERADLFSLGAVAWELFAGRKAFTGSGVVDTLSQLLLHEPEPLQQIRADLPELLSRTVEQLLRKDASQRPSSAADLARRFAQIRSDLPAARAGTGAAKAQERAGDSANQPRTSAARAWNTFWRPPRTLRGWMIGAAFSACIALASILTLQTPDGTLVVEFDDSADLRIREGKLEILDEKGELRYTLQANSQQQLAAGKYLVKVIGVDGLSVDTPQFEMTKGKTVTLRVTAQPNPEEVANAPEAQNLNGVALIEFPGKPFIDDQFAKSEATTFRSIPRGAAKFGVTAGSYWVSQAATSTRDVLVLPVFPYDHGLTSVAFASRFRSGNGNPFINFCAQHDGTTNRFLSLVLRDGGWQLYVVTKVLKEETWIDQPPRLLASGTDEPLPLAPGQWREVAARWDEHHFELWVDGRVATGGALPEELKPGEPTAMQFCVRAFGAGETRLELDLLRVWDQSGIDVSARSPSGLPLPTPKK